MNAVLANLLGVSALVCWSMSIAVTRRLGEAHGLGLPGLSYVLAGLAVLTFDRCRRRPWPWRADADPKFWWLGGGAFVAYGLFYVAGLSWSPERDVVLSLGLVNYFWPALVLVLAPCFFPYRVRWGILSAGLCLCVGGVGLSMLWGLSPKAVAQGILSHWPAFAMMSAAAVLWALYTNAARRWGNNADGVGWFLLAIGLAFLGFWWWNGRPMGFGLSLLAPLLVHALLINALAYLFWDWSVRWGNLELMGTLANFLPLGAVGFGAWYLGGSTGPGLWVGCLLVMAGALLCRRGLKPA